MDPTLSLVASDIGNVAAQVGTRVLLVGAYARDLCLGPTSSPTRGTNDADFAVLLENWDHVDAFFSKCLALFRDVDRAELKMYHRTTGLKVDIVPCGPIETPPGTLALRGSVRRFNTVGLAESFELGTRLHPAVPEVLVPPPAGFLVLKLFAFTDRRERRDLRDLGHVLTRFPIEDDLVWADDQLLAAFADGSLTYEDVRFWQVGRDIAAKFTAETTAHVIAALDGLLQEKPELRSLVVEHATLDPDERLERADRALQILRRACGATPD
jgi:predicted nucleotidyltransferase